MPSEKRRQRQQRVRHEAGDTSSISSATANILREDTNHENEHNLQPPRDRPTKGVAGDLEDENLIQKVDNITSSSPDGKIPLFNNEPKNHIRSQGRKEGSQSKGEVNQRRKDGNQSRREGNQGKSRGNQCSKEGKVTHSNSVAFEEEKEYEPVTVMPLSSNCESDSSNKKYRRREVISNWLRYDELPTEDETVDGEDYLLGEDFSEVLTLQGCATSGGYLHLKGEKSWGDVSPSHLGNHGLGAIKVVDLIAALATIPLHQQLKIPEESLPYHYIRMYNSDAETHQKTYKPGQEYVSDVDVNEAVLETLKLSLSDTFNISSGKHPETCSSLNSTDATSEFSKLHNDASSDSDFDTSKLEITLSEHKHSVGILANPSKLENTAEELNVDSKAADQQFINNVNCSSNPQLTELKTKHETIGPNTVSVESMPSSFNFGLSWQSVNESNFFKKSSDQSVAIPKTTGSQITNKSRLTGEEMGDSIAIEVSRIDEVAVIKPSVLEPSDAMPKVKEPVILVANTEMENLEDWLDSVLDD